MGSPGGHQPAHGDGELAGIYCGIVTQNKDEDGPGGRVRLRFPWLPEGQRDQLYWAQIVVPMVGVTEKGFGYGVYTLPEVDDQVLVMFMGGYIGAPIVVGGVYSRKDPPPEANQGKKNDFRVIKSRSGHRVILDDSDNVKVALVDRRDQNTVTVGEYAAGGEGPNRFEAAVPGGMSSEPEKGVSVAAVSLDAVVRIWCPKGKLTVRAPDIDISASKTLEIKGETVIVEAGERLDACSQGNSNYQGKPIKVGP